MKKITIYFVVFVMLVSMLAGCENHKNEHEHVAVSAWDRDVDSHWRLCECGEKAESGQHVIKNDVCTVCGTFFHFSSWSINLQNLDENGHNVRVSDYKPDDPSCLEKESVTEYEYFEAEKYYKCTTLEKVYEGGILSWASESVGVWVPEINWTTGTMSKEITREEDGTYTVYTYDVTIDGDYLITTSGMIYVYDMNGELIESREPSGFSESKTEIRKD